MKKSLILVGLLSIGYAHAQEGNVGINAEDPKATLDIRPEASKLAGTSNEGIIAPKLTKERIASIAVPVEGTLVYATNAEYTGNDLKVAKIDEKGYYYFDGTEWVKAKNVAQDQEWVYDAVTNRINLRRSGDTTGTFKNKVFYNVETGQYVDIDDENNIRGVRNVVVDRNVGFEETLKTLSKDEKYKNFIHSESKNLHSSIARSSDGTETTYKQLGSQSLVATEDDNTERMYTVNTSITVPPKNSNNFVAVYGDGSNVSLYGTGEVSASIGQSGGIAIGNTQSVKGYATGLLGSNAVSTSGKIAQIYGVYARNFFYSPTGANVDQAAAGRFSNTMPLNDNSLIKQFIGLASEVRNSSQNTGTGQYQAGVYSTVVHQGKTKYPNMYGIFTNSVVAKDATAPDNHYGLYIGNVQGGGKTNHAIYTGLGKVRLGDNTVIKTDVEAPKSSITTNGHISAGFNDVYSHRAIFIGASIEAGLGGGTFVGFGTYKDDTAGVYKFKTSKDNDSNNKNRFLIFNDSKYGKVYFSPFIVNDGKVEQDFRPDKESIFTISHEGKKIGIGTIQPENKLHIKADSNPLRLEGLQASTEVADKVVVVDATGVLKTVDRSSIGGGTQGIAVEADGVIGNEVKDATADRGLERSGNGDASSPYTLGIKEGGVTEGMLSAGSVTGDKIANGSVTSDKLNIPGTNKGDVLVWNGSSWVSQAPQSGASLDAITGAVKVVTAITKATWAEKVDGKGIFALSQTGDAAIQLPNPADYKFRIIAVNNQYTNQLNYASEYSPTYSALDSGKGHLLISDGQKWMIIGGSF